VTVAEPKAAAQTGIAKSEEKKLSPIDSVRKAIDLMKPQMALALPRHLTPERFARVSVSAIQANPKLLNCNRISLFAALMTGAQLGLEPDGVLGQAYLIPFGDKVQFIPGYKGLISLARNSGEVNSIAAHVVHERDRFEYEYGLEEKLVHKPAEGDRGAITHFYAIARFKQGGHAFEVLTLEMVLAIRDKSSGYKIAKSSAKSGEEPETPWVQHFAEMGRKTAIRKLAKYLPMNVQKAAAIADAFDSGRHARLDSFGELYVEPAASIEGEVIDVGAESSGLDSFAGSSPATDSKGGRK